LKHLLPFDLYEQEREDELDIDMDEVPGDDDERNFQDDQQTLSVRERLMDAATNMVSAIEILSEVEKELQQVETIGIDDYSGALNQLKSFRESIVKEIEVVTKQEKESQESGQ
jgi:hypothetical protein